MQQQLNAFDLIIAPRQEGVVNLVDILYRLLRDNISEQTANKFILQREIINIKASNPIVQMVILNRMLLRSMLLFRGRFETKIYGAVGYLIKDCNEQEWIECISRFVIPFLKKYSVLENTL